MNRYNKLKDNYKIILSLSGGLDSRSIGCVLKNNNIPFGASTFIDKDGFNFGKDAEIAKLLANKLNVKWCLHQIKENLKDIEKLLNIKAYLNNFLHAFIIGYNEFLLDQYGKNISLWSRDEGNAWLDLDTLPVIKITNIEKAVEYILYKFVIFNKYQSKEYLKIDLKVIKQKLLKIIDSYPEKDFNNKIMHFYYFQYLFRVQYEGEDRDRAFFWTIAPMYSLNFKCQEAYSFTQ